jgi:putative N-acetyltransferase (TIGR04045 family)
MDVLPSRFSLRPDQLTDCRPVSGAVELAEHHRIRRAVFVAEQGLFDEDDMDGHDRDPATIHVLGLVGGTPAGTVRLYPSRTRADRDDGRIWHGDRLAVLRQHRRAGLGAPLVRHAVATAAGLGGSRMLAQIQLPNVSFFLALGWRCDGEPAHYLGQPHQRMQIALR